MRSLPLPAWLTGAEPVDWDAVYREQLPRVYSYFRYRVGDDQLAEDLTAATFEKAWRTRQQYRRDRAAIATWLFAIARNVAIDHYRRPSPPLPLEHAASAAVAQPLDELVAARSDHRRLEQLLAQLGERERELIALKYGSGLTNRAIATLTGLSESNVGSTLHRLIRRLRAQWEEPDDPAS